MTDPQIKLPDNVETIKLGEKTVYLVGTAHVSKESVEDVRATVAAVNPDAICVELCQARYKSMVQRDNWKKMNLFKVIKERKTLFLLIQLIMTAFYKRLGKKLGAEPGAEMLEGVKLAESTDAQLVLADRDIEITLKRVWGYMSFFTKMNLLAHLILSIFGSEEIDAETIEKMKMSDQLETIMEEFTQTFPEIKKRLIVERDIYLAQKIRSAPGNTIVAVVGAAHVPGIKLHIDHEESLDEITQLPPKSILPKIIKVAIPLTILIFLYMGFRKGGIEHSAGDLAIWIFVNGALSALGAAIALGHPLTVIASFVAAPITSGNPWVASGFVSGLVQTWIKKPTVEDFEDLPQAITTTKGFWKNPVTRILLVVMMASFGSVIGTIISGIWIGARAV
ncbi:MAG: TraB/GumN family protein [Planctomycetes bacterium]|nr:TraB/GumN family protein [Planctomycetota bacterium]